MPHHQGTTDFSLAHNDSITRVLQTQLGQYTFSKGPGVICNRQEMDKPRARGCKVCKPLGGTHHCPVVLRHRESSLHVLFRAVGGTGRFSVSLGKGARFYQVAIKAVTFLCQDTGAAAQKTDDYKLPDPGLITTFQNSDQEIALPPGLSKNTFETGLAKKMTIF